MISSQKILKILSDGFEDKKIVYHIVPQLYMVVSSKQRKRKPQKRLIPKI